MVEHLRRQTTTARKRLGHRGAVLLLLGLGFIAIGVSLAVNQNDPSLIIGYAFLHEFAPFTFWGGVFIMVGSISAVTAFFRLGEDAWGFTCLSGLSAFWSMGALMTFFTTGLSRAIITFLIWGLMSGIIALVSGMAGPNDD